MKTGILLSLLGGAILWGLFVSHHDSKIDSIADTIYEAEESATKPDLITAVTTTKTDVRATSSVKSQRSAKLSSSLNKTENSQETINRNIDQYGARTVILYSAKACNYCQKAKRYLIDKNINFVELFPESNSDVLLNFNNLQGTFVPLIYIGEIRLEGFNGLTQRILSNLGKINI